jgi:hypothetical protein
MAIEADQLKHRGDLMTGQVWCLDGLKVLEPLGSETMNG